MSRLTEDDVRVIRTAWDGGAEINEMARHYGVTPTAIWLIVHRKNWTHVA